MRYSMILSIIFIHGVVIQPAEVFGQSTATLSLRARKYNDILIGNDFYSQTNVIYDVKPGDTIEIDMWISGWDDPTFSGVRSYQIILDCDTYLSFCCDNLLPLGWDAPIVNEPCTDISVCSSESTNPGENCGSDSQCPAGICLPSSECSEPYSICNPRDQVSSAHCTGPNFDPTQGAFIKEKMCSSESVNAEDFCQGDDDCAGGACVENEGFIHANIDNRYGDVSTSSLCTYTFGGFVLIASDQVADIGEPRYVGTFILQSQGYLEPINLISIEDSFSKSFLSDALGNNIPLLVEPLTITPKIHCDCFNQCWITDSTPHDCAIDARYPWDPTDPNNIFGWDYFDITLDSFSFYGCDVDNINPSYFEVSIHGGAGLPPAIIDVSPISDDTVRVTLSKKIPIHLWTCLTYKPAEIGMKNQVCFAKLPADVNGNLISKTDDVASIIDHLNGKIALDIWQCDVNHSGSCNSSDILGVIDMLNGAGSFIVFTEFVQLVPCPSAP